MSKVPLYSLSETPPLPSEGKGIESRGGVKLVETVRLAAVRVGGFKMAAREGRRAR
jgi:hypothetical protein